MAGPKLDDASEPLQEMIAEMVELAKIPTTILQQLGDQLQNLTGFPKREFVESIISAEIPDETQGAATRYAIRKIGTDDVDQVFEVIQLWQCADEDNKTELPDDRLATLQKNLQTIVRDYPALDRMDRANQLKTATGNEVQRFGFFCDARPVPNSTGDDIDGFIPLATFKIFYERQNLEQEEIEFVLTIADLDQLIQGASFAMDQLTILRTKLSSVLPSGSIEGGG